MDKEMPMKITFKFNQLFRKLTKNKKRKKITLLVKGRNLIVHEFYDGIAKFKFEFLCDNNLGAEDYIEISNICKFVVIENIPTFNSENINQQQRFITLVDIFYEKKISLMISLEDNLENLNFSKKLICYSKELINLPKKFEHKQTIVMPLIRKKYYDTENYHNEGNFFTITIIGGSQGAKIFDTLINELLVKIVESPSQLIVELNIANGRAQTFTESL